MLWFVYFLLFTIVIPVYIFGSTTILQRSGWLLLEILLVYLAYRIVHYDELAVGYLMEMSHSTFGLVLGFSYILITATAHYFIVIKNEKPFNYGQNFYRLVSILGGYSSTFLFFTPLMAYIMWPES